MAGGNSPSLERKKGKGVPGKPLCVCGVCTCGSHKCPGCIPHPKFDAVSAYKEQFHAFDGSEPPIRASAALRKKRFEETKMTPSDPGQYETTTKSSLEATIGLGGARQKSYRPIERRIHTSPFNASTTMVGTFKGATAMPAIRKVPATTLGTSMAESQDDGKAKGFFSTTNQDMLTEAGNALRAAKSPDIFRAPTIIPQAQLSIERRRFEGASSYGSDFQKKTVTREGLPPRRLRQLPPHVKTPEPEPEPPKPDYRTTSAMSFPRQALTPANSRCPAGYLPKRPPSEDGHIRFRQDQIS